MVLKDFLTPFHASEGFSVAGLLRNNNDFLYVLNTRLTYLNSSISQLICQALFLSYLKIYIDFLSVS